MTCFVDTGAESCECFGTQAQAFAYNPRADTDDEDGDAVGDVWGMPSLSEDEDEEEEVSSEDSFSEEGMSPSSSPPPDDSRCESGNLSPLLIWHRLMFIFSCTMYLLG